MHHTNQGQALLLVQRSKFQARRHMGRVGLFLLHGAHDRRPWR
ncbi:hypothetical protein [Ectopseudomonas oleovorans]|nr:hypothetical protein [Pseudomonas indoloxydans]